MECRIVTRDFFEWGTEAQVRLGTGPRPHSWGWGEGSNSGLCDSRVQLHLTPLPTAISRWAWAGRILYCLKETNHTENSLYPFWSLEYNNSKYLLIAHLGPFLPHFFYTFIILTHTVWWWFFFYIYLSVFPTGLWSSWEQEICLLHLFIYTTWHSASI